MRRLHQIFPELSGVDEKHLQRIEQLGPDFYQKIIPHHLELNAEYSLLGQQLRGKFPAGCILERNQENEELLSSAIKMAELLKSIYQHYLIVPREVERLRNHQERYINLLNKLGFSYQQHSTSNIPAQFLISPFSQHVREMTRRVNLYRILLTRSKKALELFAALNINLGTYRNFIKALNQFANPFLAYLGFLFFLPRLGVNLFLTIKHTIPGFWMGEKEKSLGWTVRFKAQLQRRWFELGNDLVWVAVGAIHCFLLIGPLAPLGAVLSLAAFAFDIVLAAARVYVELEQLYHLRGQYRAMQSVSSTQDGQNINHHLEALNKQIQFERFRLGMQLMSTLVIFSGMTCVLPLFALNPIIPIIAATILVALSVFNLVLAQRNKKNRPKDTLENPPSPKGAKPLSQWSFFAKEKPVANKELAQEAHEVRKSSSSLIPCSIKLTP